MGQMKLLHSQVKTEKEKEFISTRVQNFYYSLPLRLTSQFHHSYSDHHRSVQYLSIKYKL